MCISCYTDASLIWMKMAMTSWKPSRLQRTVGHRAALTASLWRRSSSRMLCLTAVAPIVQGEILRSMLFGCTSCLIALQLVTRPRSRWQLQCFHGVAIGKVDRLRCFQEEKARRLCYVSHPSSSPRIPGHPRRHHYSRSHALLPQPSRAAGTTGDTRAQRLQAVAVAFAMSRVVPVRRLRCTQRYHHHLSIRFGLRIDRRPCFLGTRRDLGRGGHRQCSSHTRTAVSTARLLC